jgi:hypothetical protein
MRVRAVEDAGAVLSPSEVEKKECVLLVEKRSSN